MVESSSWCCCLCCTYGRFTTELKSAYINFWYALLTANQHQDNLSWFIEYLSFSSSLICKMSTCLLTGLKFATRIKVTFIHKKSEMLKVVTPRVKVNVNSLKDGSESWAFVFQDCLDWKTLGPTRMEDWNLRGLKGLKRLLLVTALLAKLCRLLMQR